jgi:hypothetical protein
MKNIIKIPDEILYLVHTTSRKYKDENGNLIWSEIKAIETDQHPGAYFSLITKDNRLTEKLFPATECLIFSRNLLKQMNYHINMCDNNGYITEGNTFFPWNLEEAIEKIKENAVLPLDEENVNYHRMNEVVIHDAVPMEYLCLDMQTKFFSNDFLPKYPIENEVKPNMSLLPFYCFAELEEKNRYKSSSSFFKKIAELCNIDKSLSKDEIIEKIIEKAPLIHENRNLQNIDILQNIYMKKNEYSWYI